MSFAPNDGSVSLNVPDVRSTGLHDLEFFNVAKGRDKGSENHTAHRLGKVRLHFKLNSVPHVSSHSREKFVVACLQALVQLYRSREFEVSAESIRELHLAGAPAVRLE